MELSDAPRNPPEVEEDAGARPEFKNPPPPEEIPASGDDSVVDFTGESWEMISPFADRLNCSVEGIYVYKNVFNLIPRSVCRLRRLKTLKFFANEIEVFPSEEAGELVDLEQLQVKLASPGLLGLSVQRLKALKELELCMVPPRMSAFNVLSEVSSLKCLRKLSVCHFSIRWLCFLLYSSWNELDFLLNCVFGMI